MVVELSTAGVSRPDLVLAGLQTGYFDARTASVVQLHGPVHRHTINQEVTVPVGIGLPGVSGDTVAVTTTEWTPGSAGTSAATCRDPYGRLLVA